MKYPLCANLFSWVTLFFLLTSCSNIVFLNHSPTGELGSKEIRDYTIAYCWQYPEGRQSKTLSVDQEVVVVVSQGDGSSRIILRNEMNLLDQNLSDFLIYKSGCIAQGNEIRFLGNIISWRPSTNEVTYTEGSSPELTRFSGSKITSDFAVIDGDLTVLLTDYKSHFGEPRGVFWTQDGMKLATLGRDHISNALGDNIWVYDIANNKYSRITNITEAGDFIANASWSKGGNMLAVEFRKNTGIGIAKLEPNSSNFSYIEVTHASSQELDEYWPYAFTSLLQLVTQRENIDFNSYVAKTSLPVWLNNDKQIVFAASSKSGQGTLFIVDSDGSGLRQLIPDMRGLIFMPTLSPDEKTLAYVRYPSWTDKSRVEIAVVDLLTMEIKSLVVLTAPKTREILLISGMSWSSDGKYLAFSSNHEGESDIYIISSDGDSWVNLTKELPGNAVSPVWKP